MARFATSAVGQTAQPQERMEGALPTSCRSVSMSVVNLVPNTATFHELRKLLDWKMKNRILHIKFGTLTVFVLHLEVYTLMVLNRCSESKRCPA